MLTALLSRRISAPSGKIKIYRKSVLKGGLFIYSVTNFDSRVTVDIDFLLRRIPNTPEQLRTLLEEIISCDTGNDFVTFEIKSIAPIAIAKKYAGIGAGLIARIKNTRTPFGIDFDGKTLSEALRKTFVNREHRFTLEQFEQVMGFDSDAAMQKKWKAFVRKIDTKTDDYSVVLKTIKVFLTKPFTAAVNEEEFIEEWSAANSKWM